MRLFRKKEQDADSQRALEEAREHVQEAKAREEDVIAVTEGMRRVRERNHISEQLNAMVRARREACE